MPGRLLPGDYGNDLIERTLKKVTTLTYPFLERATDCFGCCQYIPTLIHATIFHGRADKDFWTVEDVVAWIDEFITVGRIQKWKAKNGNEYIVFARWFAENSYMAKTRPQTPRPPLVAKLITEAEWEANDKVALRAVFDKFKKGYQSLVNSSAEREGEKELQKELEKERDTDVVHSLFLHYKEVTGKSKARLLPACIKKTKTRLDTWEPEQLKKAITNHWSSQWRRDNLGNKTLGWIMRTDTAVTELIGLKPEKKSARATIEKGEE